MKKKYTLSIADIELNVTVDEAPETVEYIVGVIDRKMRDILLKSKYCPKTQAALLCALDLCADKVKAKEEADKLEDEIETLKAELKASDEKYTRAQSLTVALESEKVRLEIENMKLRALLEVAEKNAAAAKPVAEEICEVEESVEEAAEPVAEEICEVEESVEEAAEPVAEEICEVEESVEEVAEPVAEEICEEAAPVAEPVVEVEEVKRDQKSRVGSMFDLLTFDEI